VLAREGYRLITGAAGLAVVLIGLGSVLGGWGWALALVGAVVLGFTLWFFRDPPRVPPAGAAAGGLLLAPADGKVVELVVEEEPLYLQGPAQRVSIFLSPLNVHVNRAPCDGAVEFVRYVPGEYLVAWHPKASEKNERSEIGVRHPSGTPVLFKQIAGAVARRIVFYLKVGDRVRAGERFGIVKFGSRMDVIVPPDVVLDVRLGQRTVAGVTVIGRLPARESGAVPAEDRAVAAARAGGPGAVAAEVAATRPAEAGRPAARPAEG
jgi:phosphatidylserine decarboxylase